MKPFRIAGTLRALRRCALLVAALTLISAPTLHAQSGNAPGNQTRDFQIPAGELSEALSAVARQSGLTLSLDPKLVASETTEGLDSRLSVRAALSRLLADTGLRYELDNGTLTLAKSSADNGPTEMAPLTIEAVPQASRYGRDGRYQPFDSSFVTGGSRTPLVEVPFSATVIDEDFLRDNAGQRLDRVAPYVAGVQTGNQSNNSSQVFQSRGFQLGRDSILINGTRQADAFAITPEELVSRVDFYRGPSSILNGATPPGGAANIVTKKPMPESFTRVEANVSQHDERKLAADYNSGQQQLLGLPASFRVNVMGEDSGSFRDHVERDNYALAPVTTLQFGERTTLTLEANFIDWENTDDRGLPLIGNEPNENAANRFDTSDFLLGTTDEMNDREQQRYMLDLSHQWTDSITTNLQATYGETERSQFTVFPVQFDPNTNTLARAHFGTKDEFESSDIKLDTLFEFDTGIFSHEALAALQYRDFKRTDNFTASVGPTRSNPTQIADTVNVDNPDPDKPFQASSGPAGGVQADNNARELFIQDSIDITEGVFEGVHFVAGTRYIDFNEDVDTSLEDEQWISRVGLGYTPPAWPLTTFYGNFSESFDTQSGTTARGEPIGSQEGEQWEIGAKSELLQGELTLTLAYFNLENSNVSAPDPNNPGSSIGIDELENAGFEVEAVGNLTERLQMQAQYTRNDSEIRNDASFEGNKLQLTPEDSASLWLNYDLPTGTALDTGLGKGELDLFAGIAHVGERFTGVDNSIELHGYQRTDLGARYTLGGATDFELNLLNAFDERYFTGGNAVGLGSVTPGQARTVQLSMAHEF